MAINEKGNGLNPSTSATGVYGSTSVTPTISNVEINRYFPGLLLKKGLRLLITSTINDAEMTDSINHPVLKISFEACRIKIRTPNVR